MAVTSDDYGPSQWTYVPSTDTMSYSGTLPSGVTQKNIQDAWTNFEDQGAAPPKQTINPFAGMNLGGYGSSGYDAASLQLERDKLALQQRQLDQEKALREAELAQQKQLEEERLAQEQKVADQNTVETFNKGLMDMRGPADPYGYLFASRGLMAPQGYAPAPLPIPDAVKAAYQSQGVDLASLQNRISGSAGPSFIQGYLGGMPAPLQQGPMGFKNVPTDNQPIYNQPNATPSKPQETGPGGLPSFAMGGTVSGPVGQPQLAWLHGGEQVLPVTEQGGSIRNPYSGPINQGSHPNDPGFNWGMPSGGWGASPSWGWSYSPEYRASHPGLDTNVHLGTEAPPQDAYSWQWVPLGTAGDVNTASGQTRYFAGGQEVGPGSQENAAPPGYGFTSPGVAQMNPPWVKDVEDFFGGRGNMTSGPVTIGHGPITGSPLGAPPGQAPLLTGGTLNPLAPPGTPPMNLDMLDPYTRSMVDMYGRPQIPSAQALANMPQSGQDAYKDYVEKVAGGNYQDLLGRMGQLAPQGAPTGFNFQ